MYVELHGYDRTRALTLTREIYGRFRNVFEVARDFGIPTSTAADGVVEQRLAEERRRREVATIITSPVRAVHVEPRPSGFERSVH